MIDIKRLYDITNNGLDIILHYYPQAKDCVNTNKSFKIRDEDDASARIKMFNGVYKVTDFGDEGEAQDPLDIAVKEECMRFHDVLFMWASKLGLESDAKAKPRYTPEWEYRPALPEEKAGDIIVIESEKDFTKSDLNLFGTKVTMEHVQKQLNWVKVKEIRYIKSGKASIKKPTDIYPIYARRCYFYAIDDKTKSEKLDYFYKIYEPYSDQKQYRFGYAPRDKKPARYINGLYELKKAFKRYNESQRAQSPEGEDYESDRLEAAVICSGERDAACVKARGYWPIWFNSETFDVSAAEIKEIFKYVIRIYNIPDIDGTGIKRGTILAKRYWDIYTIWLPEKLKWSKDWRGNSKKDFRDYCDLYPKIKDFNNLLEVAIQAKFWKEYVEKKGVKYAISSVNLLYFLKLYGFFAVTDDISKQLKAIKLNKNRVEEVRAIDIKNFLKEIAKERFLPEGIRNLLIDSPKVNNNISEDLDPIQPNFKSFSKETQLLFFQNANWLISKEGIKAVETDVCIWEDDVIPHRVNILDSFFNISYKKTLYGQYKFDIEVKEKNCCFLNYIINTSRIYWREELEDRLLSKNSDEILEYQDKYKFAIDGPLLNKDEIEIQKQNLVNKIFTIGYLLHRYKGDSIAWAPFLMDGKVGEDGECNGRSGKSFFLKALTAILNTKRIDGRMNIKDKDFLFDGVNQSTDMVYFDDASRDFPIKRFYSLITSDFYVNPKGMTAFNIPYEVAPKLAFTTNYIPYDFDSSTVARLLFVVFSDYYHEMTLTNGYIQNRSIRDDFGKDLMRDYTDEEWNLDFNFMAQCLHFYLKTMNEISYKIQPPMGSIMERKYVDDMGGEDFVSWAYTYFAPNAGNLDCNIDKNEPFRAFKASVDNSIDWKPNRFMKALQGFVNYCDYIHELNPKDVCGSNGRIQEWRDGKNVTCIHVRSKKRFAEIERDGLKEEDNKYIF